MRILILLLLCASPALAAPQGVPVLTVVDNGAQVAQVNQRWIKFENATPDCTVCSPSRMSIFMEQNKKRWIDFK